MTGVALRVSTIVAITVALAMIIAREGSTHSAWLWVAGVVLVASAAVFELATKRGRGRQSALSVLIGLGSVGVGIGIAPAWLTKAGLGTTSIAGIVALAGGLTLLALAYLDVGTSLGRLGKLLSGFGLVLLVVFTALTLSVAVAATNVPPTDIGETPAMRGLDHIDVELVTEDGVVLDAWYTPSRNGANVVLLHGSGSTRSSVLDQMEVLAANGYGVLAFDARGHGRSQGRAMDFGWFGDLDASSAIQWLAESPEVAGGSIALVGMSMGGEQAIGVAASDERVVAVVAEGATGRTAADKLWLPDLYGARGWIQRAIDMVRFGLADALTEAEPPMALRDAVAGIAPRPLLLITAGNVVDEEMAARYIQSGSPDTVDVWVVEGADHTRGLEVSPAEWEERVVGFLRDAVPIDG